ncbi:MAG TPA: hypothetical protein VG847_04535 [Chitinophagaceae bacterium]|nr:hypothetical protein [Chitinophagaceae bacterium]
MKKLFLLLMPALFITSISFAQISHKTPHKASVHHVRRHKPRHIYHKHHTLVKYHPTHKKAGHPVHNNRRNES